MMEVNENLTRQVANLARLNLSKQEIKTFTSQLTGIIHYIEKLQEVDVNQIEPMTRPHQSNKDLKVILRKDEVISSPLNTKGISTVTQRAAHVLQRGFKVPPIF